MARSQLFEACRRNCRFSRSRLDCVERRTAGAPKYGYLLVRATGTYVTLQLPSVTPSLGEISWKAGIC
eukprot:375405-Prymnesium_polylepis.1